MTSTGLSRGARLPAPRGDCIADCEETKMFDHSRLAILAVVVVEERFIFGYSLLLQEWFSSEKRGGFMWKEEKLSLSIAEFF